MERLKRKATLKQPDYAADPPGTDSDADEGEVGGGGEKAAKRARNGKGEGKAVDEKRGNSSEDGSDAAPAKMPRRKGRKGKLASFHALPLDLLVEVARHLDPLTLLHLSRANKALHRTLASRKAIPLWREARRQVYLPDLAADDKTEMQYVAMMLEAVCSVCGKGRASIVDYFLRRRWCKDCQHANLLSAKKIEEQLGYPHDAAFKCTPSTHHSVSRENAKGDYYAKLDVAKTNQTLWELQGKVTGASGREDRLGAIKTLDEFIEKKVRIVEAAKEARLDGKMLEQWNFRNEKARYVADKEARADRLEDIIERLVSLGYDREDCSAWHRSEGLAHLVDQPKKLTNLIWKRISPAIIEHVDRRKTARLRDEAFMRMIGLRVALAKRYNVLLTSDAGNGVYPTFDSWLQLPAVRRFWEPEQPTALDDEHWTSVVPELGEDVKRARRAIELDYARKVVEALEKVDAKVDPNLASRLGPRVKPTESAESFFISFTLRALRPADFYAAELDLDRLAHDISPESLPPLFEHPAAIFACCAYDCSAALPFPAVQEHIAAAHLVPCDERMLATLPLSWAGEIVAFLDASGLADATPQSLQALGEGFECTLCEHRGWGMKREKHSGLDWDGLIKHFGCAHRHSTIYEGGTRLRPGGEPAIAFVKPRALVGEVLHEEE
ncbi:hypothetical protein JCM10449v2_001336 [Rhodotorula kratochvilovae]